MAKRFFTGFYCYMNNVNFTGINISNADVLNHKLSIYRLTEKDKPYLKQLKSRIDLKNLFPNINDDEYRIYDAILKRAFDNALVSGKNGMLLACDNIPCGIMVNSRERNMKLLDYICTWPVVADKKAPFGAQTLFVQMFKDFLETGENNIVLYATRFGSAISKYLRLGFKSYGGDGHTEIMRIGRNSVIDSYNKLKEKINLIPASISADLDLFNFLK